MSLTNSTLKSLPPLNKVIVIGSGGRENSLAWALRHSSSIKEIFVAPGNGGTQEHKGCESIQIAENDHEGLIKFCKSHLIDLVIIGPETPLAAGLSDKLRNAGIAVFGPNAAGAKLEASKAWAKELMVSAGIPTAEHWSVQTIEEANNVLKNQNKPLVVKADGLAAGKGVTVPETIEDCSKAINAALNGRFGAAGTQLVLEEKLNGPEVSVFALCDGERLLTLPPAQDHKRLEEGDQGPNTGGMGAYAPAPLLDKKGLESIEELILKPTLSALKAKGIDYKGVIYAGLILTKNGPKVIEFNCRFGDPECQTLMPLMGPELPQILQACALGRLDLAPKLTILKKCSVCVVAAAYGYPDAPRLNDTIDIQLETDQNLQIFHAGTRSGENGKLITSGGRVLSIVSQSKDFDQAFTRAYKGLNRIHFKGIHYRKDIGHQVRKSNNKQQ